MKRFLSLREMVEAQRSTDTAFRYLGSDGLRDMSFCELLGRIDSYPVPEADVVGLLLDNDIDSVISLLALAGRRQLVLMNPDDDQRILSSQIRATHVGALIGDDELRNELGAQLEQGYRTDSRDILLFTSGTTQSSRAVALTEQNLCSATYNGGFMLPLKSTDSLLCMLPLSHVFGLVCSLLWPLSFGCTICLGSGIRGMVTDFSLFHPTAVCLVPQMARFMAAKRLFNQELKLVLIGAGDCDDMTLSAIKAMGIRVSFGYGLTETSSGIALSVGDDPRLMSICPDYSLRIADDGEIVVSSKTTMMKGYYEDEKATAEVLKGGELFTGDLGVLEDGKLRVTGRKKEMLVFSDGSKLFIPEYEQRLSSVLGQGMDFAITQTEKGDVALFLRCAQEAMDEIGKRIDAFNRDLPRSHQINEVVRMEGPIPRTRTGKVRRYDLDADNGHRSAL